MTISHKILNKLNIFYYLFRELQQQLDAYATFLLIIILQLVDQKCSYHLNLFKKGGNEHEKIS